MDTLHKRINILQAVSCWYIRHLWAYQSG